MIAVLQRVKRASVKADGVLTGEIGEGLLVLLGVGEGDTEEDAALLAADYDYQAAVDLIGTFPGDITAYPELGAKQAEYAKAETNMVTWSDPSQITVLSFHTLIADPSRAFTNAAYGTAYNRNFVTTGEFSKILQQLYDKGYILVSLSDLVSIQESNDGKAQVEALSLRLPLGKKPLLLVQTNANYYTYMVDGN